MMTTRRIGRWLPVGVVLAAAAAAFAGKTDPPHYARRGTWQDTLLAARRARRGAAPVPGRTPLPDFGAGPFTVTAWVRTSSDGTILARTAAKGEWEEDAKSFFISGGRLCYDIGWVDFVQGGGKVTDGKWHHVAVARGEAVKFYVDGRPDGTGDLEFPPDNAGHVVKIGYTSTDFPERSGFRGEIDELRVYARELSAEEVRTESRTGAAGAGVVAHWPFDKDGRDATGGGNDAAAKKLALVEGRFGMAAKLTGRGLVVAGSGAAGARDDPLWRLVERDFSTRRDRGEIARERADGIWLGGVDDPRELARRYAAGTRTAGMSARAAKLAASVTAPGELRGVRELYHRSRELAEFLADNDLSDLAPLRRAVEHQMETCGDADGGGRRRLAGLDALRGAAAGALGGGPEADVADLAVRLKELRREVLLTANPLIDFDKLLFVKRYTYQSNHYYTDYINGCGKFGGNLCVLSLKDGKVTELVPSMASGIFGRFDLSFDATRVVFDWKASADKGFRIYEVGVDGRGLRQLTFDPPDEAERVRKYRNPLKTWQGFPLRYYHYTDDMQPCYLPDGGICFISTRCEYGTLCDEPDVFTTTVLYRMDGDGGNIRKLTNSPVSEASPAVMNDGRVLYTRWEYYDKGAVSVKCLWSMYPDGTRSEEVYGNDIALPPTFLHGRAIPGYNHLLVMLGTPHCPQNGVGTVIRVDTTKDIRTREPMTYITPNVDIRGEGGFHHRKGGRWVRGENGPLYGDPCALSRDVFLVSHNADKIWRDQAAWDLYLLDSFGNHELIHDEPGISCWQPTPLRPRKRPPVLKTPVNGELARQGLAVCLVADVYHGLGGVERGAIKYIRVNEQVPRAWAVRRRWDGDEYDQQHACISKDMALGLKVQHGVVPVEADGSAHFLVPADRNISFQVLDKNFMEVQRERTYVNYRPGETRSCGGCHPRPGDHSPPRKTPPLAMRRAPSRPGPQPGEATGARPIHYPTDVQPVLDKYCIRCHGADEPKADLNLTGRMTDLFSVSYESLLPERRRGRGRRGFSLIGQTIGENHPKTGNVHYLPPRSLGSHSSVLVAMLSRGAVKLADPKQAEQAQRLAKVHEKVTLAPEDMIRLTTWVDSNAQYYGSYWGRRHIGHRGHPNFRPVPTFAQAVSMTCHLPEQKR